MPWNGLDHFRIEVFDFSHTTTDEDSLGFVELSLSDIEIDQKQYYNMKLHDVRKGEIQFEILLKTQKT